MRIPSRGAVVPPATPPPPEEEDDDDDGPGDWQWASPPPPRGWGTVEEEDEDGAAVVAMPERGGGGEMIVAAMLASAWTTSADGLDDGATGDAMLLALTEGAGDGDDWVNVATVGGASIGGVVVVVDMVAPLGDSVIVSHMEHMGSAVAVKNEER